MKTIDHYFYQFDADLIAVANKAKADMVNHKKALAELAKEVVDDFYEEWRAINVTHPWKKRGILGVRLRVRGNSLAIDWETFRYTGAKGKRVRLSSHVTKGRNYRQPMRPILSAKVKDWELELFKKYEPLFALIRQRAKVMQKTIQQVDLRINAKFEAGYEDFTFKEKKTAAKETADEDDHDEDD